MFNLAASPLRYPGGKAKLYSYFAELISKNRLFGAEYCEPYAGGAGLAIKLLTTGFIGKVSINDIDTSIYSFWLSVLFATDQFCKLIEVTPITIEEWHRQKAIWIQNDATNQLALGFATYFLNRTNRSGIIEGAGPIGGYAQAGNWKLDVRLVKQSQIENIRLLSRYAKQIDVSNFDASKFLSKKLSEKNVLIYLDPPYYVKGHKLYKNFYQHSDHIQIAECLKIYRNKNWIVSYDNVPQIHEAYKSFRSISYSLKYSAGRKTIGSEVMFSSDAIVLPDETRVRTAA